MDGNFPVNLDLAEVPTPCYVVDDSIIKSNVAVLDDIQQKTGCRILLALKGFAMFSLFPLISRTLYGICASSPHEARLGREEFGREVHTFAAAFSEADITELMTLTDHLVFNSFNQWRRFRSQIDAGPRKISCGIRVNPEHSEGRTPIYDPCAPGSRLGVRLADFEEDQLDGLEGLHFHTLCEQNFAPLERTVAVFEEKFAKYIDRMQWINFGGGHHITRSDYDRDGLCRLIAGFQQKYGVQIYLEPGEAIALNAGTLVATVLDVIHNDMDIAIIDTSASAHMPDVLEMPYRPHVIDSGRPGEKTYTYRLAGLSCLAGDVIGEYSFANPLKTGDKVVFTDMAHYTMVKNTTFNGIQLPSIAIYHADSDRLEIVRQFDYTDYRNRLS